MKKTLLLMLLMVSFVLVLSACADSEDASNEDTSSGDTSDDSSNEESENASEEEGDVNLRIAWWGGEDRHERTLEVIEMYEEQNPHVTIETEYSGFDGYFDKLSTQFAAGNAPDIIQYGGNLNDYVLRDVVLPLNQFLGEEIDVSLHDKKMLESATFDDELYGVTLGSNAFGLLLNKTKFEEAGVEMPSKDWTWNDFNEITAEITESLDGVYGTQYFGEDGFGVYIDQNDKVLHEDGVLQIEKQDVQDWFELWVGISDNGGLVPPEIQAESSQTPEQSSIVRGDVAIEFGASNQLGAYAGATEDEIVLHNPPYNDLGNHGASLRASQYFAGYSETEHPEEVAKFLNFFVNNKEAAAVLGNDRGAPVNSEIRKTLIENANELDEAIFAYVDFVSSTNDSPFVPNLPGYNETQAVFKSIGEEIFFEQTSIEDGVDYYWEELNSILDDNRE
ncbi:ABC transporter substrate-binding protein [Aquibacillus saliphilus]|uniref:ABC transporter substrate-binding protein n=1 Tax=Aquibacillus saliphilus TaxID=1909422 RepID=UPI001CF05A83|nr:ABC transporter substrate-binding protein [Aquibacillus saliphilus]